MGILRIRRGKEKIHELPDVKVFDSMSLAVCVVSLLIALPQAAIDDQDKVFFRYGRLYYLRQEHFNSRDEQEEVASGRVTVQVAWYDESCESGFVGGEHEVMSAKKLQDARY